MGIGRVGLLQRDRLIAVAIDFFQGAKSLAFFVSRAERAGLAVLPQGCALLLVFAAALVWTTAEIRMAASAARRMVFVCMVFFLVVGCAIVCGSVMQTSLL